MIQQLLANESFRNQQFPVTQHSVFFGHAGVTVLPRCVADAVVSYTEASCEQHQEFGDVLVRIQTARRDCAELIGASADEIALLGPTSLGLSLFANGLDWQEGDEVVCHADDYPANVYPWMHLQRRGVVLKMLRPEVPGDITPDLVAQQLTPRTKLVALASCHYLSGTRIDIDAIGKLVHERGALFALDAIQTLGAFPTRVEQVDFLSADAHKWLLGPLTAGIVMVKREHFARLEPTLIGAWNVHSPDFIAQDEVKFFDTARRYEPGVLNASGIFGMHAAVKMLSTIGIEAVAARILELKSYLVATLRAMDCEFLGVTDGPLASGITTFTHPRHSAAAMAKALAAADIVVSHRHDRQGRDYIRLSPHFYNTEEEVDALIEVITQM